MILRFSSTPSLPNPCCSLPLSLHSPQDSVAVIKHNWCVYTLLTVGLYFTLQPVTTFLLLLFPHCFTSSVHTFPWLPRSSQCSAPKCSCRNSQLVCLKECKHSRAAATPLTRESIARTRERPSSGNAVEMNFYS